MDRRLWAPAPAPGLLLTLVSVASASAFSAIQALQLPGLKVQLLAGGQQVLPGGPSLRLQRNYSMAPLISYFTFLLITTFFSCFSRPHLGSVPDFRFPVADDPADSYGSSAVLRRPQKGRAAALRDEPSKARPVPSAGSRCTTRLLKSRPFTCGLGAALGLQW